MAKKPQAREVPTQDDLTPAERRAAEEAGGNKKAPTRHWNKAKARGKNARTDRAPRGSTHETRARQGREAETFHEVSDEPWVRPATMPFIEPRKGMVQRYIRVALEGKSDPTNVSRKFREGWRPRKADSLPKNFPVPTISHGTYAGCIGVEGMILCEMPTERNDQRNAFYRGRLERQTAQDHRRPQPSPNCRQVLCLSRLRQPLLFVHAADANNISRPKLLTLVQGCGQCCVAMTREQLLKHYGTQAAAAAAIRRNRQTVHEWCKANRLPLDAQVEWEVHSDGALKADLPRSIRRPPARAVA